MFFRYFKKSQMFRTQETIITICWIRKMKKLEDWQAFLQISDIKAFILSKSVDKPSKDVYFIAEPICSVVSRLASTVTNATWKQRHAGIGLIITGLHYIGTQLPRLRKHSLVNHYSANHVLSIFVSPVCFNHLTSCKSLQQLQLSLYLYIA